MARKIKRSKKLTHKEIQDTGSTDLQFEIRDLSPEEMKELNDMLEGF